MKKLYISGYCGSMDGEIVVQLKEELKNVRINASE